MNNDDATPMTAADLQYRLIEARRLMVDSKLREHGWCLEVEEQTAVERASRASPRMLLTIYAPPEYYECGEGYAHLVGTPCNGQCVNRG